MYIYIYIYVYMYICIYICRKTYFLHFLLNKTISQLIRYFFNVNINLKNRSKVTQQTLKSN